MYRTFICSLVATLLLAGCGGPSQEERDAAKSARAKAKKLSRAAEEAAVVAVTCREEVGGLLKALRATDSRLTVGMTFADYGEQVGDISVAYDQMSIGQMDFNCVGGAGVAAEKAFNSYTKAYNTWNDCIGDLYCDTDSIQPELQKQWSRATRQIARARSALGSLEAEAAATRQVADDQKKTADRAEAALE